MRKDTTFAKDPLDAEAFSEKYWMEGMAHYQYHTMQIEDGRDEREQLIINNVRAIWEALRHHGKVNRQSIARIEKRMEDFMRHMGYRDRWMPDHLPNPKRDDSHGTSEESESR